MFENIIVLRNLVEANLIRSILTEREIPFRIKEYNDPGFGSFFRKKQGWGHVAAPAQYREEIEQIYSDFDSEERV